MRSARDLLAQFVQLRYSLRIIYKVIRSWNASIWPTNLISSSYTVLQPEVYIVEEEKKEKMLVLYGNKLSGHCKTIFVCAAEMGLLDSPNFKVEKTMWDLKEDEWTAKQPFKQLPWMEDTDNGMIIYETRAIVKYMARKIKSPLLPSPDDLEGITKFDIASSFEMCDFDWQAIMLYWESTGKPNWMKEPTDEHIVKWLEGELQPRMQGYDRLLSRQKYLAGDNLTLVDLFHLVHGDLALKGGCMKYLNDGSLPNLKRWWDDLTSLDSWKRMQEYCKS